MTDDRDLKRLLEKWRTPEMPADLEKTIFPQPTPWWKWPVSGQVRLPAPVALAGLALLAWSLFRPAPLPVPATPREIDVVDFQPVTNLNPRIARRDHAND